MRIKNIGGVQVSLSARLRRNVFFNNPEFNPGKAGCHPAMTDG